MELQEKVIGLVSEATKVDAVNITETPEFSGMFKGGALQVTQACNGVQFVANAGTIKSGTFTLYKINS